MLTQPINWSLLIEIIVEVTIRTSSIP